MSLLFETVRVENGTPAHLSWHERRMLKCREEVWGICERISLADHIRVPVEFRSGIVRCRIEYSEKINAVRFSIYEKKQVRSLRPVTAGNFDYHLKYINRDSIDSLYALKEDCDDIIIIRNGLVTDSSFANLIFFDEEKWVTPGEPLLKGTCRERMLEEGKIVTAEIRAEDLIKYRGCKLINAMRYPEEEGMAYIKT